MAADELPPQRPSTESDLAEPTPEFLPWVSQGGHFIQVRPLCPACSYREQADDGAGLCSRCLAERPHDEVAAARAKQRKRQEAFRAQLAVGLWHSTNANAAPREGPNNA